MAVYTPSQLYGSGSLSENLSGLKTFTFDNPSGSAYFAMETIRDERGFYLTSSAANCEGAYVLSSPSMSFATSSYMAGFTVPNGASSFTFTPDVAVVGTTLYLRGTGEHTLTIS